MAEKINISISDEMWDKVDYENKLYAEMYLDSLTTQSDATYKRYRSDLRQFLYWVTITLNNKPLYELKKYDFERYLNALKVNGMSISSLQSKRNSLLVFFGFLEEKIRPENEKFKKYKNNFNEVKLDKLSMSDVNHPVTYEEYKFLVSQFRAEDYLIAAAFVTFMFYNGTSTTDYRLLRTELIERPFPKDADYILAPSIKKTRAGDGKEYYVNYKINRETYDALKDWVESRNFEYDYIFTSVLNGKPRLVNKNWGSQLCKLNISEILGRNVTPKDFQKSYEVYRKRKNILDKDWNANMVDNLQDFVKISEPIDLQNKEEEVIKIIKN